MNIWLNFDKIFIIATDKTDFYRLNKEFNKVNIPSNLLEYIIEPFIGVNKNTYINSIVYKRHSDILNLAFKNNYSKIVIFEDDIEFEKNTYERLEDTFKEIPYNWKFLYLGWTSRCDLITKISHNIVSGFNKKKGIFYNAHAIAFNIDSNLINYVNSNILNNIEIDELYTDINVEQTYAIYPSLVHQKYWSNAAQKLFIIKIIKNFITYRNVIILQSNINIILGYIYKNIKRFLNIEYILFLLLIVVLILYIKSFLY